MTLLSCFKYSERPGTYAAKHLPDNVSEDEKIRRLNELIRLQTEISAEQNKKDEGKEFDILIERFGKRSREQLMGRTPQNKAVVIARGNHHIGRDRSSTHYGFNQRHPLRRRSTNVLLIRR